MGANTFSTIGKGKTAHEAFDNAVQDARHEYGNRGYTGSLAEKDRYTLIPAPFGPNTELPPTEAAKEYRKALLAFAKKLIADGDERIDDKWGPAGAIDLKDGSYLFFGWASS